MKKLVKSLAIVMLIVMSLTLLVSCGPNSDPDKAIASLKDNNYAAIKDTALAGVIGLFLGDVKAIDAIVVGTNAEEIITIVYFKDSKTASTYWDKMQEYADKENKDKNPDWVVKKSGKMIYFGTKEGAKAAA